MTDHPRCRQCRNELMKGSIDCNDYESTITDINFVPKSYRLIRLPNYELRIVESNANTSFCSILCEGSWKECNEMIEKTMNDYWLERTIEVYRNFAIRNYKK